ncbi:Cysteine and glycine-rich protein 2, partial [Trachymyrmex cornetzi]
IRNCLHHNRGERPNEIELRIVSTDISSTTGEERTRVIVSACESSSSCRESRTAAVDTSNIAPPSRRKCLCPSRPLTANRCAPFRRRVSFSDATVIGTDGDDDRCRRTMQDDDLRSTCRDDDREIESKAERETFYDIWKADDSSTGRSDDGYSESTPRIDNYAETRCRVSGCTFNNNKSQRLQSENINEQTVERDEHTRGEWTGNGDVCPTDRIAGNKARNDEDDTMWNENLSNSSHKNVDSIGRNEYRMRGGCGGCCCGARENVWRSSQGYGCCCGRLVPAPNESCAPSPDRVKTVCVMPSRSCCCRPRVCRKSARCEPSPCTTSIRSCGGGRCCGGCGKPGQICTSSSPRICNSPAHSSRGRSPCAPRCPPQPSCSISGCRSFCSGPNNCRRSRSPRCLSTISNGCCSVNDGVKCGTDGACCRLRLPCECLGGGLDCRRCGRKVYQAEMQIASGVPYHNICFSCFCCRKPLEPLTYQENGGEIYCKQCYVRNFGPQGYGYGVGAGVLQTPL